MHSERAARAEGGTGPELQEEELGWRGAPRKEQEGTWAERELGSGGPGKQRQPGVGVGGRGSSQGWGLQGN